MSVSVFILISGQRGQGKEDLIRGMIGDRGREAITRRKKKKKGVCGER
jgi:hypothetical protein